MPRVLRILIAATVAFALSGGPASALAAMTGAAPTPCAKPEHRCPEATFNCACCLEDGSGAPAPAVPSSERTSVVKAPLASDVAMAPSAIGFTADVRLVHAPSTRRAGPPVSLSILHGSLLL